MKFFSKFLNDHRQIKLQKPERKLLKPKYKIMRYIVLVVSSYFP